MPPGWLEKITSIVEYIDGDELFKGSGKAFEFEVHGRDAAIIVLKKYSGKWMLMYDGAIICTVKKLIHDAVADTLGNLITVADPVVGAGEGDAEEAGKGGDDAEEAGKGGDDDEEAGDDDDGDGDDGGDGDDDDDEAGDDDDDEAGGGGDDDDDDDDDDDEEAGDGDDDDDEEEEEEEEVDDEGEVVAIKGSRKGGKRTVAIKGSRKGGQRTVAEPDTYSGSRMVKRGGSSDGRDSTTVMFARVDALIKDATDKMALVGKQCSSRFLQIRNQLDASVDMNDDKALNANIIEARKRANMEFSIAPVAKRLRCLQEARHAAQASYDALTSLCDTPVNDAE